MRKLVLYKDRKKQWRWKLIATNGKKIANGNEGYHNKSDAKDMAVSIVLPPYTLVE